MRNGDPVPGNLPVHMHWWDRKSNFGDLIGPWLVKEITGRPVVNTLFVGDNGEPTLVTVGSLLHSLRRPGLDVWGSGSIRPLDAASVRKLQSREPRKIHAVRGWKSYKEFTTKLGWKIPRIYGDPALLLPRFHLPTGIEGRSKIALVPHYRHKKYFRFDPHDSLHMVDVAKSPVEVVNAIANADACLSTSLHGVIVAQAYGVPWIWVRVDDDPLRGDSFKFEDFFTVLDRAAVSMTSLASTDITPSKMIECSSTARLPKSKFSFDALLDSFPAEFM